ncbi:hypothetical protein ABTX61_09255 [Amycolatopsis japonica]
MLVDLIGTTAVQSAGPLALRFTERRAAPAPNRFAAHRLWPMRAATL